MLISENYRLQNAMLHTVNFVYGKGGGKWAAHVLMMMDRDGHDSVLDYGCGKGKLAEAMLPVQIREYDPAIPGKEKAEPSSLVICTDVLEHIEPDCLDAVLAHLASVTKRTLFFNIATKEALKSLPDGRNAHLIVQPPKWWKAALGNHFTVTQWRVEKNEVMGEAVPKHGEVYERIS